MPAPITEPKPNQVRSHQLRQRFISFSLSFLSSTISSASSERLATRSFNLVNVCDSADRYALQFWKESPGKKSRLVITSSLGWLLLFIGSFFYGWTPISSIIVIDKVANEPNVTFFQASCHIVKTHGQWRIGH
ncbi:hypothetical protein H5410_008268, partial [Solanum commersonii]